MLIYRRTSILESSAQTLVNTVNCVGVMGKGLAKEFKDREPEMFKSYKRICDQKLLRPGKLWLYKGTTNWILNFPTKDHWRNPSKIEWIEQGLQKFVVGHAELGIREVSFPRLGCGNGGLNWDDVRPLMESYLSPLKISVFIHDFDKAVGLPEHLEHIPSILSAEFGGTFAFSDFLRALPRAVELSGSHLIDLQSHERLHAEYRDEILSLSVANTKWELDGEDLWGIWVSLQKGFLTREKAGWASIESGGPLISLLSLLPMVRLIEIQRFDAGRPEFALEVRDPSPDAPPVTAEANEQMALPWH
ncbi:macro domain-containing protein [Rhizobium sp. CG4]|uniref:macro domain-containing protein n=1 Tax=Rhizobium sp. CG4 TaxID=2726075 RepID=UPI002033EEEA|nr:macro domain-containing protein [Rhizobium sp. CG4]MCM2458840.1 macro domain-containing protein [Rhizobium sp. CG4]